MTLKNRSLLVYAVATVLLVVGVVLSASIGQLSIPPQEVLGAVLQSMGIHTAWAPDEAIVSQALWQIRFPRVVASLLVGAALAFGPRATSLLFGTGL